MFMAFLLVSSWLPASKHREEIDGIRSDGDWTVSKGGESGPWKRWMDTRAFGGLVLLGVPLPRHLGLLAVAAAHG
jgi:hypothetical protein